MRQQVADLLLRLAYRISPRRRIHLTGGWDAEHLNRAVRRSIETERLQDMRRAIDTQQGHDAHR